MFTVGAVYQWPYTCRFRPPRLKILIINGFWLRWPVIETKLTEMVPWAMRTPAVGCSPAHPRAAGCARCSAPARRPPGTQLPAPRQDRSAGAPAPPPASGFPGGRARGRRVQAACLKAGAGRAACRRPRASGLRWSWRVPPAANVSRRREPEDPDCHAGFLLIEHDLITEGQGRTAGSVA